MGARALLNLGLLVSVLVLAAVAWFEPGKEQAAPEKQPLVTVGREHVTAIRIEQPGKPAVALHKEAGEWQLVEPVKVAANRFRVDGILELTRTRSDTHFPVVAADLARYGLAPAKVVLTLDGTRIELGDTSPLDQRRYVRAGDTVHLISDVLYYHLAGDFTTFVHPSPLGREGAEITALELPEVRFTRAEAGRWQAEPGGGHTPDQINALIDAWRLVQALHVTSWQPGPTEGRAIVRIAGRESPIELAIAKAENNDLLLVRTDLKIAYHFPESTRPDLLNTKADSGKE